MSNLIPSRSNDDWTTNCQTRVENYPTDAYQTSAAGTQEKDVSNVAINPLFDTNHLHGFTHNPRPYGFAHNPLHNRVHDAKFPEAPSKYKEGVPTPSFNEAVALSNGINSIRNKVFNAHYNVEDKDSGGYKARFNRIDERMHISSGVKVVSDKLHKAVDWAFKTHSQAQIGSMLSTHFKEMVKKGGFTALFAPLTTAIMGLALELQYIVGAALRITLLALDILAGGISKGISAICALFSKFGEVAAKAFKEGAEKVESAIKKAIEAIKQKRFWAGICMLLLITTGIGAGLGAICTGPLAPLAIVGGAIIGLLVGLVATLFILRCKDRKEDKDAREEMMNTLLTEIRKGQQPHDGNYDPSAPPAYVDPNNPTRVFIPVNPQHKKMEDTDQETQEVSADPTPQNEGALLVDSNLPAYPSAN